MASAATPAVLGQQVAGFQANLQEPIVKKYFLVRIPHTDIKRSRGKFSGAAKAAISTDTKEVFAVCATTVAHA